LWAGSVLWGRVVTDLGLHGGIAVPASVIALAAAGATLTSVATAVIAGSRSQGARLTALLRAE
jgi:hypothetical protein